MFLLTRADVHNIRAVECMCEELDSSRNFREPQHPHKPRYDLNHTRNTSCTVPRALSQGQIIIVLQCFLCYAKIKTDPFFEFFDCALDYFFWPF